MHIREVNISGFRSYRESTNIEAFDRGHNVVVGRNGSGKSNFFFAIQFLLSEEFAHLKQEQRLSMLHEGAGSKITTARVEMVFDNSDRRIPSIEGNEVRVVRQVGHKKDQYHIDGKVVPRADVVNLMESAGFSRSNPYYIVKQGKINELATAPDSHRLKLLKEVAGTRVYDERKEESEKILKETTAKSEKIASLLAYINERLQTLKEESEDLDKYQTYDKMKRSIEYTKLDQEMKEARSHLDKLSDQREEYRKNMADGENQLSNLETELVVARNKLKDLEKTFQGLREEKEALCTEKVTRIEKQAELDLQLKDLNEEVANQRNEAESDEVAKAELETEIGEKTDKLEELVPRFHELQKQEATLQSDIRIAEAKLKELEAKQGHKQLFASADERDKFLKEQVKKLEQQIYETQQQMKKVQDSMVEGDAEKEEISAKIQQLRGESEEVRSQMDEGHQKSQQKRKKLEEIVTEQLDAGRKEKHCRNELLSLENDIQHLEVTNRQVIPRNVYNGIQSVNRVLQHFDDNGRHDVRAGYRGTLMELFSTDPIYYRAIEATAGNRLFHHVVDNDTIAMQILKRMNQDHLHGEVNFFPLNRISASARKELPAEAEKNARMMLDDDILEFDPRYDVVMRSVFGGTAIARALDNNATMLARQHGLDCVTLEGDQVSRRGAMTGGFVDVRRSKLEAFNTLREKREARQAVSDACSAAAREVADKSREVDRAKHEIATLDQTISQLRDEYREKMEQCRYMSSQLQRMNMAEDPRQQQRVVLENRVREMTAQRDVLKEDIGQQLSSQMSSQQIGQVADLRDELQNKRDTLKQVSKSRVEVEQEKHKLENILHGNLLKRKARIEAKMDLVEQAEARQKKQAVELELASVRKRMAQIERKLVDIEQQFKDNYTEQAAQLQGEIDNLEEQAKDHAGQMDEWAKQSDLICTRQSTLVARRDDASRKIRELGSIPSDAFSKYANMSSKALTRKLEECMQQLKKYENVNKKAMDQYLQATQQREDLQKRMDEQTANEKSITDLLGVLDQRKYDAIMLTFKQVSKNFKEVFTKLVPTGYGELVMQTTGGGGHDSQSMDSESADKHLIEKFSGVGIKVSFTGSSETREMQQLSGGQKSLVALALIFSIQKCDPAPFYLFDEIDAALDQQHRVAVADMIHELSSSAQFITTTFRPELLQHAKKYYGVKFRNKVSHIDVVTKEQAYDFVEDDQTHG